MGRSNLCEDREAKRYNHVAGILTGGFREKQLTTRDISRKTGIPERTINERLQHPETTRLEDLYKLCDVAGVRIVFELKEVPE
ncbi:MAG: helix-turn-helix transcriptional regulator [Clostridiales bacterium]|nr:helix-turn-helix transcriptional regulator [Roseburia sp.]MDD7636483.1 helix-turn-helix transcriptional regulator [Clostridiales bacterium]